MWGLDLDTIVALDVVLADRSIVHATTTSYPDVYFVRGTQSSSDNTHTNRCHSLTDLSGDDSDPARAFTSNNPIHGLARSPSFLRQPHPFGTALDWVRSPRRFCTSAHSFRVPSSPRPV